MDVKEDVNIKGVNVNRIVWRIVWGDFFVIKPSIEEIRKTVSSNLTQKEKNLLCPWDIKLIANKVADELYQLYRWQIER